jgi:hypothetical protein
MSGVEASEDMKGYIFTAETPRTPRTTKMILSALSASRR